ncbi:hypothetical protein Syun_020198 [Stephania yunnanensis]|uniref:Uncharacterized protein n=1 Tax=Stephania yunnanensis TaxID=152371 RepID=A0AAP0IEN6_9MAGN
MSAAMLFIILPLLLLISTDQSVCREVKSSTPASKITVMGIVYCDICSSNTFSKHSYFLPGVEVNVDCKIEVSMPATTEQVSFSVNRTTDKFGVYKLDIPSFEGVKCAEGHVLESLCRASLIGSAAASSCDVPSLKMTADKMTIKSKQTNQCIYCLNALSFRPSKKDVTMCATDVKGRPSSMLIP